MKKCFDRICLRWLVAAAAMYGFPRQLLSAALAMYRSPSAPGAAAGYVVSSGGPAGGASWLQVCHG
eukprot:3000716-Pyramimonas_sp.AAC.1